MNTNPQNSNPFIDDDEERSIENTICNVSDGLLLVKLGLSSSYQETQISPLKTNVYRLI